MALVGIIEYPSELSDDVLRQRCCERRRFPAALPIYAVADREGRLKSPDDKTIQRHRLRREIVHHCNTGAKSCKRNRRGRKVCFYHRRQSDFMYRRVLLDLNGQRVGRQQRNKIRFRQDLQSDEIKGCERMVSSHHADDRNRRQLAAHDRRVLDLGAHPDSQVYLGSVRPTRPASVLILR